MFFEPELPLGPEYDFTVTDRSRFSTSGPPLSLECCSSARYFDGSGRSFLDIGTLYLKYAASFLRTGLGVGRLRDAIMPRAAASEHPANAAMMWSQAGFYSLDQELSASAGTEQTQLLRRRKQVLSPEGRAGLLARLQESRTVLGKPMSANGIQRAYVDYILRRTSLSKVRSAFIFMPMNDPPGVSRIAAMTSYLQDAVFRRDGDQCRPRAIA